MVRNSLTIHQLTMQDSLCGGKGPPDAPKVVQKSTSLAGKVPAKSLHETILHSLKIHELTVQDD